MFDSLLFIKKKVCSWSGRNKMPIYLIMSRIFNRFFFFDIFTSNCCFSNLKNPVIVLWYCNFTYYLSTIALLNPDKIEVLYLNIIEGCSEFKHAIELLRAV